MSAAAVRVDALGKTYDVDGESVVGLADVTFAVPAGASTAILGPSGSGKSTLMTILAGLQRPTSGSVHIGDIEVTALSEPGLLRLRAGGLAVVVQRPDRNLLPYGTVADNIRFAQRGAKRVGRRDLPAVGDLLSRVGIGHVAGTRADRLSGGERQRLSLAVGFAAAPSVLLADEPTSQLDAVNRDGIIELLRAADDVTVIVVTHDSTVADALDSRIVLRDGRMVNS
jgi:ABC-type lipoprotein export system ATPase subunit